MEVFEGGAFVEGADLCRRERTGEAEEGDHPWSVGLGRLGQTGCIELAPWHQLFRFLAWLLCAEPGAHEKAIRVHWKELLPDIEAQDRLKASQQGQVIGGELAASIERFHSAAPSALRCYPVASVSNASFRRLRVVTSATLAATASGV